MSENLKENINMNPDDMRQSHDMSHYDMSHRHEYLIKTIQECEVVCEEMTTMLKRKYDVRMRVMQLQLLRDCADICGLTVKYIARHSIFSKCIANLCAYICEMCGRECSRFSDAESQHCARICLKCARECSAFAMMS